MPGLADLREGQPGMTPLVSGQPGSPGDSRKGTRWTGVCKSVMGHGSSA